MSIEAMEIVKSIGRTELPRRGRSVDTPLRFVLFLLADYANDGDHCVWVSRNRLADETGLERGVVSDCLRVLDHAGLLRDTGRREGRGRGTVVWRFLPDLWPLPDAEDAHPPSAGRGPRERSFAEPDERADPDPDEDEKRTRSGREEDEKGTRKGREKDGESRPEQNGTVNGSGNTHMQHAEAQSFEAFWSQYPVRVREEASARLWKDLNAEDRADAINGLTEWCRYWTVARIAERYIPHPSNWLGRRQWRERPPSTASSTTGRSAPGMDALRRRRLERLQPEAEATRGGPADRDIIDAASFEVLTQEVGG